MSPSVVIAPRFNGPARSGNGGYAAGSLAEQVPGAAGRAVEVTLRRPPPLATELGVEQQGSTTRLVQGDVLVAEARLVDAPLEPPGTGIGLEVAAAAMLRYPGLSGHPFPTCFSCGPDRAEGDGLRIFPGPVSPAERGLVASLWVPHTPLDVATTWAALDCVGGWSEDLEGRPCVLGRMTARLDTMPVLEAPHVVVGRHLGSQGRKSFTASSLHDAAGRVLAVARHTWILVDPAAFN